MELIDAPDYVSQTKILILACISAHINQVKQTPFLLYDNAGYENIVSPFILNVSHTEFHISVKYEMTNTWDAQVSCWSVIILSFNFASLHLSMRTSSSVKQCLLKLNHIFATSQI